MAKASVRVNVKVKKPTMKDRLKNPVFLVAASALTYKVYTFLAAKYGLPIIESGDWRTAADLVAYTLIGVGINSSFTEKK